MNATKNQNYHIFCLKTIFVSLSVGAGCCRLITGLLGRNPGPELTQPGTNTTLTNQHRGREPQNKDT